jgi:hypothetical protein
MVSNSCFDIDITFNWIRTGLAWSIIDSHKIGHVIINNVDLISTNNHAVNILVLFLGTFGKTLFIEGVGTAGAPGMPHTRMDNARNVIRNAITFFFRYDLTIRLVLFLGTKVVNRRVIFLASAVRRKALTLLLVVYIHFAVDLLFWVRKK